jgi:hypothetical protein
VISGLGVEPMNATKITIITLVPVDSVFLNIFFFAVNAQQLFEPKSLPSMLVDWVKDMTTVKD